MKTKDQENLPLLLKGVLLLENVGEIFTSTVKIRILDVSHIDMKSIILTELIQVVTTKMDQTEIPFKIFGPKPDPALSYIVDATIFIKKENKEKKTLYRTTESIPVFLDGYPDTVKIPLMKI
ncbi:hypothetical protein [Gelidibacter mesophilus]|uniref:hypothetical protein n=1 Tax=Gelidibacter mesophilus TaxID=169050 RepID=UPI0012FBEFD7|nr:hypothetical protein [Gelidibacter mesophilus]